MIFLCRRYFFIVFIHPHVIHVHPTKYALNAKLHESLLFAQSFCMIWTFFSQFFASFFKKKKDKKNRRRRL